MSGSGDEWSNPGIDQTLEMSLILVVRREGDMRFQIQRMSILLKVSCHLELRPEVQCLDGIVQ